eukprot:176250_1
MTDLGTFISLSDLDDDDAAGNTLWEDNLPPWFRVCSFVQADPLISLNNEILELCDLLQTTKQEENDTDEAISFVKQLVNDVFGNGAEVRIFGSKMTGLSLPASDIDCVVCGVEPDAIHTLGRAIYRQKNAGKVEKVEVVASARVPIVKFHHMSTGRAVDISFNMVSGIQMGIKSCENMAELPPVRPLVLLLKKFLQQRGLHETYQGGIGSFMLQIMVVRLVQDTSRRRGPMQFNLGSLLLDFFLLYGYQFHSARVGLSIRNGGSFFRKQMRGWYDEKRPYLFSVENPEDVTSDVGKNSYQIMRCKKAFACAYDRLYASIITTPVEGLDVPCSFLKEVIYPDAELRVRKLPMFPTFVTERFQHYGKAKQKELDAAEAKGVGFGKLINPEQHSEDSSSNKRSRKPPRKREREIYKKETVVVNEQRPNARFQKSKSKSKTDGKKSPRGPSPNKKTYLRV